ncbi:hypothetical protein ACQP2U_20670 [Nocardia sp. CA-084685]
MLTRIDWHLATSLPGRRFNGTGVGCMTCAIVRYFFNGVVPERGTRCHD